MSICVPQDVLCQKLSEERLRFLEKQFTIIEGDTIHLPTPTTENVPVVPRKQFHKKKNDYRQKKEICTLYHHTDGFYLPFGRAIDLGYRRFRPPPLTDTEKKSIKTWPVFRVSMRPEQQTILQQGIDVISRHSSLLLALYPGAGKTMMTLRLCRILGVPVVILLNRLVLMEQWVDSIRRCFGDDTDIYQKVTTRKPLIPGKLFYIVNAMNVPKFTIGQWKDTHVQTVVVDECHLIMTRVFVQSLGCICPRYCIGLSATPYRSDGMNELFEVYFRSSKTCIYRPLYRHHVVHILNSPIKFENRYDTQGRLLWHEIIDQQSFHPQRCEWIVRLCRHFCELNRRILVLGKRVESLRQLSERIPRSSLFTGTEKVFDPDAPVLLSTFSKVGTGFSHDCLDMLILLNDTEEYFLQYLGRVFRRPDVVPIILDIVDRHPILQQHVRTRREVYTQAGGVIQPPPQVWRDIIQTTTTS